MSRFIAQIVGQPGAGKTEACQHLYDFHGLRPILVSDLIREYADIREMALRSREDYSAAHRQMLRELGKYAITETIISKPFERISVDGIRVPAHVERLRQHGPVIALHCPPEVRYERILARGRELDQPSYTDFLKAEGQQNRSPDPFEISTLTAMEGADYHVDSSQPLDRVKIELSNIIEPS